MILLDNSAIKLVIVPGGSKDKILEYLCKNDDLFQNNVRDRIIFAEQRERVQDYYYACDIFLSSSRSEGFSYSILEALYFNKYVVSSNLSAVLWCEEYENTYLFKNGDDIDCANKIRIALNDYQSNICVNSSESIIKKYNIDEWADLVSSILLGERI